VSENHIEALRPMVLKMGERVGKMKGLPDLSKYRCWHLPGDHVRVCEDGTTVISTEVESTYWPKIDKVILKALNAMNKRGTRGALDKLQEAAFIASISEDDPKDGVHYVALRLLDTRRKVVEYGRLRKVAQGHEEPRHDDRLFYGDAPWEDIVERHAVLLRGRGILQKQKKPQQEKQ
jgi:hypothetical protein